MNSARAHILVWTLAAPVALAQEFNLDFQRPGSSHGLPSATYGAAAGRPGHWQAIETEITNDLVAVDGTATGVDLSMSYSWNGYFLDGQHNGASGEDNAPRCGSGSIVRMRPRVPNAGGQAYWGPGLNIAGGWQPAETRYFQLWYRDPTGACASGFNLTNGYQLLFTL